MIGHAFVREFRKAAGAQASNHVKAFYCRWVYQGVSMIAQVTLPPNSAG
jgi:hypothetical protein